jgi:formylglycine-generating enzyme required for sulfatase activity
MRGWAILLLVSAVPLSASAISFADKARAKKAQQNIVVQAKAGAEKREFDIALDDYERALHIKVSPELLVEIGLIYEQQKDSFNARDVYQAYLSTTPDSAPKRAEIQAFLSKLEASTETRPGRFSLLVSAGRMVAVPAGDFVMGLDGYDEVEKPKRTVTLEGFSIDAFEITNQEYNRCIEDGKCNPGAFADDAQSSSPRQPVVGVTWTDAATYCAWVKKRLPTEAEWEKAARGTDSRLYPWGTEADCKNANYGTVAGVNLGCQENPGRVVSVGSYSAGASPYGALDLAGNVQEWVADWYLDKYYASAPNKNPQGPSKGEYRVIRGGSFGSPATQIETTDRKFGIPTMYGRALGFRCVRPDDPTFTPTFPEIEGGDVDPTPPLPAVLTPGGVEGGVLGGTLNPFGP